MDIPWDDIDTYGMDWWYKEVESVESLIEQYEGMVNTIGRLIDLLPEEERIQSEETIVPFEKILYGLYTVRDAAERCELITKILENDAK
jgi:hypothetical protein